MDRLFDLSFELALDEQEELQKQENLDTLRNRMKVARSRGIKDPLAPNRKVKFSSKKDIDEIAFRTHYSNHQHDMDMGMKLRAMALRYPGWAFDDDRYYLPTLRWVTLPPGRERCIYCGRRHDEYVSLTDHTVHHVKGIHSLSTWMACVHHPALSESFPRYVELAKQRRSIMSAARARYKQTEEYRVSQKVPIKFFDYEWIVAHSLRRMEQQFQDNPPTAPTIRDMDKVLELHNYMPPEVNPEEDNPEVRYIHLQCWHMILNEQLLNNTKTRNVPKKIHEVAIATELAHSDWFYRFHQELGKIPMDKVAEAMADYHHTQRKVRGFGVGVGDLEYAMGMQHLAPSLGILPFYGLCYGGERFLRSYVDAGNTVPIPESRLYQLEECGIDTRFMRRLNAWPRRFTSIKFPHRFQC